MSGVFRKALPLIGAVAGTFLGGQTQLGYAAGAALGGAIGSAGSQALAPDPKIFTPKVLPLPDEGALIAARRRKQRSAGRASTIFTDVSGAGGGAGNADRLGP